MRAAVVDTSTWISCARAGLLPLLDRCDFELVILDVVRDEAVSAGSSHGHADAAIIAGVLHDRPVTTAPAAPTIDAAVLQAAIATGLLITNDLALGRRAHNLGIAWLRTADLVVLAVHRTDLDRAAGRAAIEALRDAQRITATLAQDYLEELQ